MLCLGYTRCHDEIKGISRVDFIKYFEWFLLTATTYALNSMEAEGKKVPPLHTLVKTASDNASSEVRIMSELVYQHQH